MKNKKGFTLMELLAVITIIGLIMVIAIPSILTISNKMKSKMWDTKLKLVETAAAQWAEDNSKTCSSTYKTLTITDLIKAGYLDADDTDGTFENGDGEDVSSSYVIDVISTTFCESAGLLAEWNSDLNKSYKSNSALYNYVKSGYRLSLEDVYSKFGYYMLSEEYFNELNFDDGTNYGNYRIRISNGEYYIYRAVFNYNIDIYIVGEDEPYQTLNDNVDDENAEEDLEIATEIVKYYDYESDTCDGHIFSSYDDLYDVTDYFVNASGTAIDLDCAIYFTPKVNVYWLSSAYADDGTTQPITFNGCTTGSAGFTFCPVTLEYGVATSIDITIASGYKITNITCESGAALVDDSIVYKGTSNGLNYFTVKMYKNDEEYSSDCSVSAEVE